MGCCGGKKAPKKPPQQLPDEALAPDPDTGSKEPDPSTPHLFEEPDTTEIVPPVPPVQVDPPDFRIGLGALFPDFECRTTDGTFSFHSFLERQSHYGWTMLFSHPKDFTPVCTTELAMCTSLAEEFQRRSVQLIGLSCDSVDQHKGWTKDVLATKNVDPETTDEEELGFPLIADETREIASMLGMLDPLEICNVDRIAMPARALFLIGPDKRNRLTILYPATTGRNFSEVLRVIDSLHITHCGPEVGTPADWHFGEDVMPATNVAEDAFVDKAKEKPVPSGRRYMRHIPQPIMDSVQKIRPHAEVQPGDSDFRIKLGAKFPDFDWSATKQGINRFHHHLDRLKGDLTVMICWPRNFDPVATTELMGCLKFLPDLRQRRVSMIGMSCDGVESLGQWVKDAVSLSGSDEDSGFTMIADRNLNIAATLGLLPSDTAGHDTCPARGLFVIGKDKTLRLSMQYPMTTGLNFAEILRVLDSLILTKDFKLVTPANWQQRQRLLLDPKVSKTDASKFDNLAIQSLPSGKEYLRWVDCPKVKWFEEEVSPASPLDVEEWEPLSPPGKGQQEIRGKEPVEDKDAWCLSCGCGP